MTSDSNIPNGTTHGSDPTQSFHPPSPSSSQFSSDYMSPKADSPDLYDLICVGFGPASLAIAIALRDMEVPARVLFLERQPSFAWHSGMLLPSAKMQISFMKDLATFRNPRSKFTFINYLHEKGRLATFTNLGTFLPLREEYNDYMAWCAGHFADVVKYSQDVVSVSPVDDGGMVRCWEVVARTTGYKNGPASRFRTKNVVIAVGGKPKMPPGVDRLMPNKRIIHTSQYSWAIPKLLDDPGKKYSIAVVGAGQSSAEVFNDLHSRYPASKTSLFLRQHALKPSDDSPFVNEIFDPDRVDVMYSLSPEVRAMAIREDRATNYSVVRLTLIESLYETMYRQRMRNPDERQWQHTIHGLKEVTGVEQDKNDRIRLKIKDTRNGDFGYAQDSFDAVIFGTGYRRDEHQRLLKPVRHLLESESFDVGRDYRVFFRPGMVAPDAGIFLQGCCETTHGLSDSLLSLVAVRAGEIVDTIFHTSGSKSPSTQSAEMVMHPIRPKVDTGSKATRKRRRWTNIFHA